MVLSTLTPPLGLRRTSLGLAMILVCSVASHAVEAQQRPAQQPSQAQASPARPGTSAAPQQDQAAPAPEQTNAVFGDWTYRCIRVPQAGTAPICEVITSIQAQAQGQVALNVQIAVGPSERQGLTRIAVGVPANVLLGTPIRLTREPVVIPPLAYDRCVGGWCRAVVDIDADTLQRIAGATAEGRVQYQTSVGQEFIIPVSFRGFQDAVAAMRSSASRN